MEGTARPSPERELNPEILTLGRLRDRLVFRPEETARLPLEQLREVVKKNQRQDLGDLALELTARYPFADAGYVDFYSPGRCDCETNLVYMTAIHQVGASVGEWEGTVGYARFTAPADGPYIVIVNVSGYQQTMRLNGPWGTSTAHTATTASQPRRLHSGRERPARLCSPHSRLDRTTASQASPISTRSRSSAWPKS